MMDESVLSYLGIKDVRLPNDNWSYILELAKARDIATNSSSTRENQLSWGRLCILEGEEQHHEEI